ncbi:MAG: bifunctional adenosylcobinamide kinase/adenosylcobinamide-phosphate guanylyltransferase [Pseudomonadota bacterium]
MKEHFNASTFILGGARSGKSRRAQTLAEEISAQRIFIATAEPFDEEMLERITRHRSDRGPDWQTVEAPLELSEAISRWASADTVCLVDCLTLWLSNLMHADRDVARETDAVKQSIRNAAGPVVLVSNEVGFGLVPETPLGRRFRDAQGRVNQEIAAACDRVEFIAAGLSITLKG